MTKTEIKKFIIDSIEDNLNEDNLVIDNETIFEDFGMDDLDTDELIEQCEHEYSIRICEHEYDMFSKIIDIINLIDTKING